MRLSLHKFILCVIDISTILLLFPTTSRYRADVSSLSSNYLSLLLSPLFSLSLSFFFLLYPFFLTSLPLPPLSLSLRVF